MGYTPPYLYLVTTSGGYRVYAPTATAGEDLFLHSNTTDTYPIIKLNGGAGIVLYCTGGTGVEIAYGSTVAGSIVGDGTDLTINSVANRNIKLVPGGTGQVKFGTYTAGAATDSTGYITILDAAGNTRKLMVQA